MSVRRTTTILWLLSALAMMAATPAENAYLLLNYVAVTGDSDRAAKVAEMMARWAEPDEHDVYQAMSARLARGNTDGIVQQAKQQVSRLGFTFRMDPPGDLVADLLRDLLLGLEVKNAKRRMLLSRDLAQVFPDQRVFEDIAGWIEQALSDERMRLGLRKQGAMILGAARERQQQLKADTTPKNFYEERKQQLEGEAEREDRAEVEAQIAKDRQRALELQNKALEYKPADEQLAALVKDVLGRLKRGELPE